MAGCSGFPVQFLYWPDSVPELATAATTPYLAAQRAPRMRGALGEYFARQDATMKHIDEQTIAVLAGIAGLCALAFLALCLSPALAATLSRGVDLGTTLSVVRSMIYPLCAIKFRLPPFGAHARVSINRIISCFDCWKETT